jgi:hypothetical protein
MRKLRVAGLVAALVVTVAPADAAAPEHDRGTNGPFADVICGVPGSTTVTFNNVVTDLGNDTIFLRGRFSAVFTATDSGKSITIKGAGPVTSQEIVDESAGTITFIETTAGLPELVKITGGPVLTRDAGLVAGRVRVFAIDPETGETGELLSEHWDFLAGPHPDLESGFEHFCEVVEPYLLDP